MNFIKLLAATAILTSTNTAFGQERWCYSGMKMHGPDGEPVALGTCPPEGTCPLEGMCDSPDVRDLFIPQLSGPISVVKLQFHVLCADDGSGCLATLGELELLVERLNQDFAPARIQFVADSRLVNDSQFLTMDSFGEVPPAEEFLLKDAYALDPVEQLNIFVTDLPTFPQFDVLGDAIFPWFPTALTNQGGIMLDFTVADQESAVLTHEVGHALGLWHTFRGAEEVGLPCSDCWECANARKTGNDFQGDFCFDTPPTTINFTCLPPGTNDFCTGFEYGETDLRNFMGQGPHNTCIDHFTPQQMGRMQCWLEDAVSTWRVDVGDPVGIFVPGDFDTIADALDNVPPGSTITLVDTIYTGPEHTGLVIDFPVTIRSTAGAETCLVNALSQNRVFIIEGNETDVVLEGLTMAQGSTGTSNVGGLLRGGGLLVRNGASLTVRDCTLHLNNASEGGGAIGFTDAKSLVVENSILRNNVSLDSINTSRGGGIFIDTGPLSQRIVIKNSMIVENASKAEGGGIYLRNSGTFGPHQFEFKLQNCTIANNLVSGMKGVQRFGGGIYIEENFSFGAVNDFTIENCILWGNWLVEPPLSKEIGSQIAFIASGGQTQVRYSDVQSGPAAAWNLFEQTQWGPGNIDTDPRFKDPLSSGGDFHLRGKSPCVNKGDPALVPILGERDIDGDHRRLQGRVEMGADERYGSLSRVQGPPTFP